MFSQLISISRATKPNTNRIWNANLLINLLNAWVGPPECWRKTLCCQFGKGAHDCCMLFLWLSRPLSHTPLLPLPAPSGMRSSNTFEWFLSCYLIFTVLAQSTDPLKFLMCWAATGPAPRRTHSTFGWGSDVDVAMLGSLGWDWLYDIEWREDEYTALPFWRLVFNVLSAVLLFFFIFNLVNVIAIVRAAIDRRWKQFSLPGHSVQWGIQ